MEKVIDTVKHILEACEKARDDDMRLYSEYLKLNHVEGHEYLDIMENPIHRMWYGVKSYESVSRARRKVQQKFPELQASKTRQQIRQEMKRKYHEYYSDN